MAELEAGLGARLLQRNTRGIALTDLGRRFYQHCQVVLSESEAARLEVSSMLAELSGRLRVSCPLGVASHQVAKLIPEFLEAYPRVELDMVMTNRRVNLLEEGIDVALRVRAEGDEDPSLATRWLTFVSAYLLASPEVAKRIGPILHPRELAGEPLLGAFEADQRTHLILYGREVRPQRPAPLQRRGVHAAQVRHAVQPGSDEPARQLLRGGAQGRSTRLRAAAGGALLYRFPGGTDLGHCLRRRPAATAQAQPFSSAACTCRLKSNEYGCQKAMRRCVISRPAALARGAIHQCVPAMPPHWNSPSAPAGS